jgi:hypothetical protein
MNHPIVSVCDQDELDTRLRLMSYVCPQRVPLLAWFDCMHASHSFDYETFSLVDTHRVQQQCRENAMIPYCFLFQTTYRHRWLFFWISNPERHNRVGHFSHCQLLNDLFQLV